MLDMEEIDEEIKVLENADCTTYSVCERLAILYTVKEHFGKTNATKNVAAPVKQQAPSGMTAM